MKLLIALLSRCMIVLGMVALSACAASPKRIDVAAGPGPLAQQMELQDDEDAPAAVMPQQRPQQTETANLPAQELTPKLLYQMLLAEVAAQRGRMNVAVTTYLEVAKATRDPRVAQRTTELALAGRLPQQALEASTIWAETDPQNQQARQIMTSMLLGTGKIEQAKPHLQKFLSGDEKDIRETFVQINNLLSRHQDKAAALQLVKDLAQPFPQMAEAQYAVGVAAFNAKQPEMAIGQAKRALELKPDMELAAQLVGQALQQENKKDEATKFYADYLNKNPKANDTRLTFARFLADQKDYKGAREQFNELMKAAPENSDITLAVGLLSMQLQDYDAAESYLTKALGMQPKDPNAIRMYLGQLSEDRKQFEKAGGWYKQVTQGEQFMGAQVKYATMLARQGKLDDGRKHLQGLPAQSDQQKIQLILADAGLLREAKQYEESYKLLTETLEKNPDSPEVLYDHAMAAEKIEKIDVLEQDLRKLIQLKPDHAHAYNALGYTLADRTTRYQEAFDLISKAVELSPEDAFILDSLGWVQYRMGKLDEALATLRKAFEARPDPEIAAHLGEVLWAKGSRSEADKIWNAALQEHPDNESLMNAIKKHKQ
jgi:tetratricopeptide (TPR) repeat protein